MNQLINTHKDQIEELCKKQGISYLGMFGSFARGDQTATSDVDLLVEFKSTPGLIGFIHTQKLFEDIFQRKVDLITKKSISKHLNSFILSDVVTIHE